MGGGRIGKKFCEIYNGETFVVTSKTEYDYDIVKNYDTIVISSSPTENPMLTKELLEKVWGYDYFGGARTVDVHVRRLRSKLGEKRSDWIKTVHSVGYKFN